MEELRAKKIKGPGGLREEAKKYGIKDIGLKNKQQLIEEILIKRGLLDEKPNKPAYERKKVGKPRDTNPIELPGEKNALSGGIRDVRIKGEERTDVITFLRHKKEEVKDILKKVPKSIKFSLTLACKYYKININGDREEEVFYHRTYVTTLIESVDLEDAIEAYFHELRVKNQELLGIEVLAGC